MNTEQANENIFTKYLLFAFFIVGFIIRLIRIFQGAAFTYYMVDFAEENPQTCKLSY